MLARVGHGDQKGIDSIGIATAQRTAGEFVVAKEAVADDLADLGDIKGPQHGGGLVFPPAIGDDKVRKFRDGLEERLVRRSHIGQLWWERARHVWSAPGRVSLERRLKPVGADRLHLCRHHGTATHEEVSDIDQG